MNRLVAIALPGGPQFVKELRRAWDNGDAVFPVDLRFPLEMQKHLISEMGASKIIDVSGETKTHGYPVELGDALVVATSGSTGNPKGAVLTHEAVVASAEATSAFLKVDPSRDKWLSCLPVSHVGGLSVICRALHTGTPVEAHGSFDKDRVIAAAERGATLTSLVPTAMERIDSSHFRRVLVGGSAVPADRPINVVTTYGMTETGSGVVYDGVPLNQVELRIVDNEVQLRCPMLMRCYRDGSLPITREGWYRTGDGGAIGSDGILEIFGRNSEMIITGGENVWPLSVEKALSNFHAFEECVVVGRADSEWGQQVAVVAVLAKGVAIPSLDEVREHVKETLPAFCAPRQIELRKSLPKTALGKVKKSLL